MLHLAAQVARLDRKTHDALDAFVWEAVELAGVHEQAQRQLLAVFLDDVLVARHVPAGDLHLLETADPPGEDVDRTAHVRNASGPLPRSAGYFAASAGGAKEREAPLGAHR